MVFTPDQVQNDNILVKEPAQVERSWLLCLLFNKMQETYGKIHQVKGDAYMIHQNKVIIAENAQAAPFQLLKAPMPATCCWLRVCGPVYMRFLPACDLQEVFCLPHLASLGRVWLTVREVEPEGWWKTGRLLHGRACLPFWEACQVIPGPFQAARSDVWPGDDIAALMMVNNNVDLFKPKLIFNPLVLSAQPN